LVKLTLDAYIQSQVVTATRYSRLPLVRSLVLVVLKAAWSVSMILLSLPFYIRIEVMPARKAPLLLRWRLWWWKKRTFRTDVKLAPAEWYLLAFVEGSLVSVLEIARRRGSVGGKPVTLGLLGGVITAPRWRGQGYGSALLEHAVGFICAGLECDFGFLMCGEELVAFYRRLGWQLIPNAYVYDQPGGKTEGYLKPMVFPCRGQSFPQGLVDLGGLPL
jgi:GNAT superfamily N-acetyltransferase